MLCAEPGRERGLSLIELMVSVAISAAVLSSLVYVYVGSRAAYRNNEALARVQETGRFALEWMSRDLRDVGYMGCVSRGKQPVKLSTAISETGMLPLGTHLRGYEDGDGFNNPTSISRLRGDVLEFSTLDMRTAVRVAGPTDVANESITLAGKSQFKPGDHLVISDCERSFLFTATNVIEDGRKIEHKSGANAPSGIDPPFDVATRAVVARLGGTSATYSGYFVGNNRAGRPALYRFNGAKAEEVVENVEDLDVLYGIDTNGDLTVNEYRKGADIGADQWANVLSVRVSVVAASAELVDRPGAGSQVLYFRDASEDSVADAQPAPNDRRFRQVFTTTVALRNQLQ